METADPDLGQGSLELGRAGRPERGHVPQASYAPTSVLAIRWRRIGLKHGTLQHEMTNRGWAPARLEQSCAGQLVGRPSIS